MKKSKLVVDNLVTDILPANVTPEEPTTQGSASELPGETLNASAIDKPATSELLLTNRILKAQI
jgi:hypothetical protein